MSKSMEEKRYYDRVHKWARKHISGDLCEHCGNDKLVKPLQRANISGEYLYDVSDWKVLCTTCHRAFDNLDEKIKAKKQSRNHCIKGHSYIENPPKMRMVSGYMARICAVCVKGQAHRAYLKQKAAGKR
jgi:hypothetical protein